jgi:hypothetical protein
MTVESANDLKPLRVRLFRNTVAQKLLGEPADRHHLVVESGEGNANRAEDNVAHAQTRQ